MQNLVLQRIASCICQRRFNMKLILSSCDFRNENSRNVILNNLPKPIDKCKLLFIPNEKATLEELHSDKFVLRMMEFGFVRENITIFDYYDSDKYSGWYLYAINKRAFNKS